MLADAALSSSDEAVFDSAALYNAAPASLYTSSHGGELTASIASSISTSLGGRHGHQEALQLPHEHTTSLNRTYSDLHHGQFLFYAFSLCAMRTAFQQPLNIALARKQTCAVASHCSTWDLLSKMYRHEGGWRAIRRGMASLSLGCALSEVIYLGLFEWTREALPMESSVARDAASGYMADVACRLIHLPLSIIAFRQMTASPAATTPAASTTAAPPPQPHRRPYMSSWNTLRAMYGERGLRTVFAGFGTTLVVGCQWTALWWALYGQSKATLYSWATPFLSPPPQDGEAPRRPAALSSPLWQRLPSCCTAADDNMIINSLASIGTSAATAVLFNPYLVIRTNLQVTPAATLWSVTYQLYRTRGLRGFYSGLWLSISTCVVDGAVASTSYEYAKLWADRTRC